ncbi:MAG: hypothetical protein CMI08_01150 [Oceanospirillaceae bacterium]|uniref:ABC transporter substrate-binding protein n=3 Tax=unclassified Thalassolituus TaxID=2624967 RepID=UPI000C36401C|nr:ABC transporter substrate-binding protein [Thalassolituus sp. UBA1505]MAS24691.1 hypothetical protein [Oceanospirillaceae bacterium]MAX97802.1 hypothetical protein [Oceanospirillaceae bacterium]MBL34846.1 hypothetical protein [Oceanospirillaceae bacterium]MBS53466.1 hypothetical protein [Oceanospirillaceae bacterium]|tara:strand:- start:2175 stop:3992 length:1818 start_codon:yes stop_codon:yes gene_type:complete
MSKVPELTPCVHDNREQTKRFRHLAARFLTALMIVGCSLPAAAFTVQYGDSDDLDQVIWQDTANPLSPGSEDAIRGGRMIRAVAEFPRNLRRIGPDTDTRFASTLRSLQLPLMLPSYITGPQDSAELWTPVLASAWGINTDQSLLVFRLHDDAEWSDGIPVSSEDFAFSGQFISDPKTGAPWLRQQLKAVSDGMVIFNNQTFAFHLTAGVSEALTTLADMRPFAHHAYRNEDLWPSEYNWMKEPTTGPYYLSQIRPGQSVTFRRRSNWWGDQLPYFANRFNTDRVIFRAMNDSRTELELFTLGELSAIEYPNADYWQTPVVKSSLNKKRVQLVRLYTDTRTAPAGLLINPRVQTISNNHERAWLAAQLGLAEIMSSYSPALHQQSGLIDTSPMEPDQHPAAAPGVLPSNITLSYSDIADLPLLSKIKNQAAEKHLNIQLTKLPVRELTEKLRLGEYELVWLKFKAPLSAETVTALFSPDSEGLYIGGIAKASLMAENSKASRAGKHIEDYLLQENIYIPGPAQDFTQAAYWQWIHLPQQVGGRYTTELFDPFSAASGGLFWTNKKERADIMAKPNRRHDKATLQVFDQYRMADPLAAQPSTAVQN